MYSPVPMNVLAAVSIQTVKVCTRFQCAAGKTSPVFFFCQIIRQIFAFGNKCGPAQTKRFRGTPLEVRPRDRHAESVCIILKGLSLIYGVDVWTYYDRNTS